MSIFKTDYKELLINFFKYEKEDLFYYSGVSKKYDKENPKLYDLVVLNKEYTNTFTDLDIMRQSNDLIENIEFEKKIKIIKKIADEGFVRAIVFLANLYFYDGNFIKVKELIDKNIKLEDSRLYFLLSWFHQIDKHLDENKSIEYLTKSAELGYHKAMNRLGYYYFHGHPQLFNITESNAKSFYWYEKIFECDIPKHIKDKNEKSINEVYRKFSYEDLKEYIQIKQEPLQEEIQQLREELDYFAQNEAMKPDGEGAKMVIKHIEELQKELNTEK